MSGATVPQHILTELAASLRAQERGIGQTLRAREIEAVARWIESWTPADARAEQVAAYWQRNGEGTA
jgi:mono/diheme cytochrome c family protein